MPSIITLCPNCGSKNRLDKARLADKPKCGSCHNGLLIAAPSEVSDSSFNKLKASEELPMVIDFWAPWCGPCKSFGPVFAGTVKKYLGRAKFIKVNTERAQQTAAAMLIRSIPTLMIMHKGKVLAQQAGAMSGPQFEQWLNANLPKF